MSETPEPSSDSGQARDDGPHSDRGQPEDDMKRRFKEALERKNARAKAGESHADASSKVHHAHGPAGNRRTFRRKSG